jgi:glycosyltransferase involved in cell wall biosynthesis
LPEDTIFLLLFGTHRVGKDYVTVLRSLSSIERDVRALFVGAVISDNNPRVLARKLQTERAMFIDGYVSEEVMALCFSACDFVMLPYAPGYDTCSGVILEACRFSRPVIAAGTGFLRVFVEKYGIGYLYEPGDIENLTAVIRRAISSEAYPALEKALSYAAAQFSWNNVVHQYLDIYRQYSRETRTHSGGGGSFR